MNCNTTHYRANSSSVPGDPTNRGDDALPELGEAIGRLEAFVAREPNWNAARNTLYSARGTRAIVHDRKGRYAEAAKDYRRVIELAPSPEARKSLRSELVGLLILARDYDACMRELEASAADSVPMYSDHIVHRILKGCNDLMKVSVWKAHPYRARAIEAARKELEHTRSKIPPADWAKFMKSTHAHKDLKHLANLPELQAALK